MLAAADWSSRSTMTASYRRSASFWLATCDSEQYSLSTWNSARICRSRSAVLSSVRTRSAWKIMGPSYGLDCDVSTATAGWLSVRQALPGQPQLSRPQLANLRCYRRERGQLPLHHHRRAEEPLRGACPPHLVELRSVWQVARTAPACAARPRGYPS